MLEIYTELGYNIDELKIEESIDNTDIISNQIKDDFNLGSRSLLTALIRKATDFIENEAIETLKPILQEQLTIILNRDILSFLDFRELLPV